MAQKSTSLTFLFTRIENSAELSAINPNAVQVALIEHDKLVSTRIKSNGGTIFKLKGTSFYAAFSKTAQALATAYEINQVIKEYQPNNLPKPLIVNIALDCASFENIFEDNADLEEISENEIYSSSQLQLGLCILNTITGTQIVISANLAAKINESNLPKNAKLIDLGPQLLQNLTPPQHLFRLEVENDLIQYPKLKSLSNYPNNLPIQSGPIVGREKEIEIVQNLFLRRGVRLVTLIGQGGLGKTRLSMHIGAELIQHFPDGVFLIELAAIREPRQVITTICRTLGLKEGTGRELVENLKQFLAERRIFLILDNFEQVIEAAPTVAELLAASSSLKIVVSSRIPLKVYGEYEFVLSALATPPSNHQNSQEVTVQGAELYPAVKLFVQRARYYLPTFSLSSENIASIYQICTKLDGLPLAIELAAARIQMFRPEIILEGLNNRLQMLVNGPNFLPERHQTLRSTIDWSYDLLNENEQLLFARLSVFAGGFTLEAAEAVCNFKEDYEDDILEGITSFLNKSLMTAVNKAEMDASRFRMPDMIREFALEKLVERNEFDQIYQTYTNFYLKLADTAEPKLTGANQVEWLDRLEAEQINFQNIIETDLAKKNNDYILTLHLCTALWRFWLARGYIYESRQWVEAALLKSDPKTWADQPDSEAELLELRAKAFNVAGIMARDESDFERAKLLLEESLFLQRQLANKAGIATTLNTLGSVIGYLGDNEQANVYLQESLELRRNLDDKRGIAVSLTNLGAVAGRQGNSIEARQYFEEALELFRQQGDKRNLALLLKNLANFWLVEKSFEKATILIEESQAIHQELGDKEGIALSLKLLADITKAQGKVEQALILYKESLIELNSIKISRDIAFCVEGLASTLVQLNKFEEAASLFGTAEAFRENTNQPMPSSEMEDYLKEINQLRQQMQPTELEAAWQAGRKISLEEAINLVTVISI